MVVIGERRGGQGESDVNWESPSNPVVVSLSSDGCVKAWDVIQVSKLYLIMIQWKLYNPDTIGPD